MENNQTAFQQSENPVNCATGCGFFGLPSTMNLCSKCYRDHRLKEEQAAAARAAVGKSMAPPPAKAVAEERETQEPTLASNSTASEVAATPKKAVNSSNRCGCCNKKVGVVGFKCRCGSTFCGSHRYPEEHACEFDFKVAAKEALAKANPLVIADKLQRI